MRERALEMATARHEKNGTNMRRDEGLTLIAEKLEITRAAVSQWKDCVPLDQVYAVAKLTGISPHLLHPRWHPQPRGGRSTKT
jgi:hypothetical protein